jgi:hypothetical protein
VTSRNRSASVDFPWSMCAMIEKFRMKRESMPPDHYDVNVASAHVVNAWNTFSEDILVMKLIVVGMVAALCAAGITLAAQSSGSGPNAPAPAQDKTLTYTGCLRPGATSDRYVLTNGKEKGRKTSDKLNFVVIADGPKVKLEPRMNQEVEITGTIEPAATTGGSPTFKATSVKWRNDYCG